MKRKKYIKISKGFFKKLNYKIEFDWDLFFEVQRLAIVERLLRLLRINK